MLSLLLVGCQNEKHKYGPTPVDSISKYKKIVQNDSNQDLVDLESFIPGIELDIRYATKNNFVGQPVYSLSKAYARKPVAEALKKVQSNFISLGYSLKIFDAYRPYSITVKFYEIYKDTTYVASPYSGSRHNRGAAIDLTIIDLETGQDVDMGTEYDDFSKKAHPTNKNLSSEVLKNRQLLISIMSKNGFSVYPSEWWHFDYKDWADFELLDISFQQLENLN